MLLDIVRSGKVSVCGTRITTFERSILNNAVKMPILSSFWDWKHFPRLKKRVQPGWQGARGNCICRCDCVTCLPNVHLRFSLPDTCAFLPWYSVPFPGLSNEYLVLVNAGSGEIVLDKKTYPGYTWNRIISCSMKLFRVVRFFSFQWNMKYLNVLYMYFILPLEPYIFLRDKSLFILKIMIQRKRWKTWGDDESFKTNVTQKFVCKYY